MTTTKIDKFFREYGFRYVGENETYRGHISHAKNDYYENHRKVLFTRDNKTFIFVSPISGSKLFYLKENENDSILCNDCYKVAGFNQQQFIDNAKDYFQLN